ncbi:MAG: PP2C family protein-serine/threonine phosphatase [Melioribacteraceae bacterium]|nr:PP2C family protein-serine/threonine phosphatase [Melioribacteraceae bacterium]
MNQKIENIIKLIQSNQNITDEEKNYTVNALQDINKELEITAFKLDRTEKIKKTTSILLEETIEELEQKRKAVEAQNRELEIEKSLEKVRTVAMAMRKPDDMLEVCKTISLQLEFLGVAEIRNVQTAIFYQERGSYTNYEYYSKHYKTFITETTYTNNELHQEFAEKMIKGKGEFFITHIIGEEVIDWIAYQKTTNVFIDNYLETASSLNYYWFSLGPVALGISTYQPLTEDEIILFKRFLKVFELSYQRYLDIEKAEAQAREAQIEAALERVRSKSMAMYTSADLSVVVFEMFIELIKLDAQLDRCIIMIVDPKTLDINWYLSGKEGLLSNNGFLVNNNAHPSHQAYLEGWRKKRKKWDYYLAGDEKKKWDSFGFTQTGLAHLPDFIKLDMSAVEAIHLTISSDDFGCLIASSLSPLSDAHADIVERFTKVFNQTYTRFLDLQKAETQKKIIQAENERKSMELEEARKLQLAMLPKELPKLSKLDISVHMQTATEVGGDYYDFSFKDNGSLNICIGDATGHGLKAGTVVSIMKSLFIADSVRLDIKKFFTSSNETLKKMSLDRMMIAFAMVNIWGQQIKIANAGIPPVFIYRKENKYVEEIALHGLPIGAMRNTDYRIYSTELNEGDTILLLSDGLPELQNKDNEMYGYERLKKIFTENGNKNSGEIISVLKEECNNWKENREQNDDITFIVIKAK